MPFHGAAREHGFMLGDDVHSLSVIDVAGPGVYTTHSDAPLRGTAGHDRGAGAR